MAARGGAGGAEEGDGRSLHVGFVSMATPSSAPLKAVLRQQMSVSAGTLEGAAAAAVVVVEGRSREDEWSGEQEDGL